MQRIISFAVAALIQETSAQTADLTAAILTQGNVCTRATEYYDEGI